MDLRLPEVSARYKSPSQIARVTTECWAVNNLYCPLCDSDIVAQSQANTRAADFRCPSCDSVYELKSSRVWHTRRVPDSAYQVMIDAIANNAAPNLLVLQYSSNLVRNVCLIPHFFLTPSAIIQRRPLSPSAKRAGWIGCSISLVHIPPDGRISLVIDGSAVDRSEVRAAARRVQPVAAIKAVDRGWTLDVLACVRRIEVTEFDTSRVYAFESELSELHPDNHNVRAKIRQQLQVLRELGFVQFLTRGRYRMVSHP